MEASRSGVRGRLEYLTKVPLPLVSNINKLMKSINPKTAGITSLPLLLLGLTAPMAGANPITGTLTVQDDIILNDSGGSDEFRLKFEDKTSTTPDEIHFWHKKAGDWIWDYNNGSGDKDVMALDSTHVLNLYDSGSTATPAIRLIPGDGGTVTPKIEISGNEVVTSASVAGSLAGKTVPGSLNVTGALQHNGAAVLTGTEIAPWLQGNTLKLGTLTVGGVGFETTYYDDGGTSFVRWLQQRDGGIWDWQHRSSGAVRTPMRLHSSDYYGSTLYLMTPTTTTAASNAYRTPAGWDVAVQLSSNYPNILKNNTELKGNLSVGVGKASSYGSVAIGYNEDHNTPAGQGGWVEPSQNSVLEVGVGNAQTGENALTVFKDGTLELGKKQGGNIPLKILSDGTVVLSKAQGDISMGNYGN